MNAQTTGNGNSMMVQGRLMWTSGKTLFEGKVKTDYNSGAIVLDSLGNQVVEYGFGLAVPKGTPEFQQLWDALYAEAFTIFPTGQLPPDFAMKFKDGDAVDHNGKSFTDREGYGGHIVLACTTQIPIKYFRWEAGNCIMINNGIKCGDYVNAQINIKAHPAKGRGKAGLYLNPSAVQLIQAGKEIINTPSGDQIFGQNAPSYAGQVIADTAPAMNQMPAHQAAPQMAPAPQAMPQAAPQMAPAPQSMPAPQAAPHYAVVPEQLQPAHQAAPQMAPAPQAAPQMPVGNYAAPAAPNTGLMPAPQAAPQLTYVQPAPASNMAPPMPQ